MRTFLCSTIALSLESWQSEAFMVLLFISLLEGWLNCHMSQSSENVRLHFRRKLQRCENEVLRRQHL